jgi:hypothetical protein
MNSANQLHKCFNESLNLNDHDRKIMETLRQGILQAVPSIKERTSEELGTNHADRHKDSLSMLADAIQRTKTNHTNSTISVVNPVFNGW